MHIVEISKAQDNDCSKIHDLLIHEKINPFMNYPVISLEEFRENVWEDFLDKTLVWRRGEDILAFVVITKGYYRIKHIAYIEIIVTNQRISEKGMGTAFFTKIMEDLAAEGCTKVELGVEVDNERAISFYKKLGFFIEGTRRAMLNRDGKFIDNYYMAKML